MCWTLEDYMMINALLKGLYEEWLCVEKMKCKLNMIHLERHHLIETCKGDMKTELSEALP